MAKRKKEVKEVNSAGLVDFLVGNKAKVQEWIAGVGDLYVLTCGTCHQPECTRVLVRQDGERPQFFRYCQKIENMVFDEVSEIEDKINLEVEG